MNTVAILSVIYHEPEWISTCESISKLHGVPVFYADRRGWDGLARAFNEGFQNHQLAARFQFVWFLTNVWWEDTTVLQRLLDHMRGGSWAAIQPSYHSDHRFLRSDGSDRVREVPFVEFTAPLVRADIFHNHLLEVGMPYTGHDIDWSYRVRQEGQRRVGVHNGVKVDHTYLRHLSNASHPATEHRKRMRAAAEAPTEARLVEKYGSDWRNKINYHGGI